MASDAPGVSLGNQDRTSFMGVKSTNSPDRMQWPPAPHRSRCRDRPPESSDDQAKIKHWRGPALQAEARLAERDRKLQKQNMDNLDLSWKAMSTSMTRQTGRSSTLRRNTRGGASLLAVEAE